MTASIPATGSVTSAAAGTTSSASSMLLAAEVSLTALTCAAAYGLIRLFADASFVPQVVTAAIVAHVLAALCRRRGLSPPVTALAAFVAMLLVIPWLLLGHTTVFGIPTGDTLELARAQVREAWALFGHVKAPAPTLPGFVLASAFGAWGLAFLADTAAFRAGGLVESMVPASTLFMFGAALGAPRDRVLCTALFSTSLLAFWLTSRAHRQLASPSWMTRGESRGTRAIIRAGALIGGVGVAVAVLLGPNLPGADAKAVIPWRASDRESGSSRVTVSPLVDIRTRIVDQAGVEVFQVKSDVRSYWRLTALESFDGRIWSSSRKYRRASGKLTSAVPEDAKPTETVTQRFNIIALDSIWLPAAFRPVAIDGTDARYDSESGSLLTEANTGIGQDYDVTSAVPQLDAALLSTATAEIPPEVAETYLALPSSFPRDVTALAVGVVGDAKTPYDKAKRLQDFFRGGNFTYDLEVPPGHDDSALERYLFETRRGYCEQFSGAYAAMARAVGLPSRVGVGFTTGDLGPDGFYSVRGYHGHAWPEVYLAGFGWIAFEPTPGRGIPGGEGYTGVPEAQASPGQPNTATTIAPSTTTTAPNAGGPSSSIKFPDLGDSGVDATFDESEPNPWPGRLARAAIVLAVLPLLWVIGLFAVRRILRWRRHATTDHEQRVRVAWDDVSEVLARSGVVPRPSETPKELAARAARAANLDPDVLAALADRTTVARYAPPAHAVLDEETLAATLVAARQVERQVRRSFDRRARMRALLDPRPATARRA
jgi:transglutaminase-like putative cysteine protease